jgi:toxin ParE1/3/4
VKVRWARAASQDRAVIFDWIAAENHAAAVGLDKLFSDAAARLKTFPRLGHPGRIPGTREIIPHQSYRLVYAVQGETVWILALVHTARIWPPVQLD